MKIMTGSPELREALRKLRGDNYFQVFMAHINHMAQEHVKLIAYPKPEQMPIHYNAGRISVLGEILEGVEAAWNKDR